MLHTLHHDQRGNFAVGEFVVMLGLWVLPLAVLVMLLPTWVERQSMARVAAQEAARELATAYSWDAGDATARAVVAQIAANHDIDPADVTLTPGGLLAPGADVTADVTVRMPALPLPAPLAAPEFSWTVQHVEAVNPYRDGL